MRIANGFFRRPASAALPVLCVLMVVIASLPIGVKAGASLLSASDLGTWSAAPLNALPDDSWDGDFGFPGADGVVRDLAADGRGNLYAAGGFTKIDGITVNHVAMWDGRFWSALDGGMDGGVFALAVNENGNLYAGGSFADAGGVNATNVAMWNGSNWSRLGDGVGGTVRALAVGGDGNLYAGGDFGTAGGVTTKNIARWDGSAWAALGSGLSNDVLALTVKDGYLYAGGFFEKAGAVSVNFVAQWDGQNWSPLGAGMNSHVYALAAAGGRVYAGGHFTSPASHIAVWDDGSWFPLAGGMDGPVADLAVRGGHVYAGGYFTHAGSVPANRIAVWNGSAWAPLGSGMNGVVETLTVDACGEVHAGGYFGTAGGKQSVRIARWSSDCSTSLPLVLRNSQGSGPPSPPPAPPSDLVATTVSTDTIQLDWVDNSDDEAEFVIQNSPDGVTFADYGTIGPDATQAWDIELDPSTTHCYRVYARNAQGDANPSNTACATTASFGPPLPLSDLTAQVISDDRILLTWTNNSSCDTYKIYESVDGGGFSFAGDVAPGNLPGAWVPGPFPGNTYAYRVTPVNSFGESPLAGAPTSNTVTPPDTPSATVTQFWNNARYPVISLQIDGVEQFPVQPQAIPPGAYYQKALPAGPHSYRASTGFWSFGQRTEMYVYQGPFTQPSAFTVQIGFDDPTISQILTRFGQSGYYVGDYWTGTLPNSAAFRFYNNGTYTFYRDGVAEGAGSYVLGTYPSPYLLTFNVTGYQNTHGHMDERTGHFYMANGPSDWPTIQYNYDGS